MLEQFISHNLPVSLPSDLCLLLILLLIRNSSDKLHVILTLKRLFLFWIPYWLIHSIFYYTSLGKIMLNINSFSLILLFIPLVLVIITRKILKKYKEKNRHKTLFLE